MPRRHYTTIETDLSSDGVLEVMLNRPKVMNAMNKVMHDEIMHLLTSTSDDPGVSVILLYGAGRGFCAGADLKERSSNASERLDGLMRQRDLVQAMLRLNRPIVSAVHGPAFGSGLALAVMSDVSIVSDSARLCDVNVRIGVTSADHAVLAWPLLCGMAKAKLYLMTGDEFSGAEAERIGLVSRSVAEAEVLEVARSMARSLASRERAAVAGTKSALNGWYVAATPLNDTAIASAMTTIIRNT
jgi:enoyl-CoA hydratase